MFEHGHGSISWPIQTKLFSVLLKLLDGDEMKIRMFPSKWLVEFYRKIDLNRDLNMGRRGRDFPSSGYYQRTGKNYQGTPTREAEEVAKQGASYLPREEPLERDSRTVIQRSER